MYSVCTVCTIQITVSGTSHQRRSGIETLPFEGFRFKSTTTCWYFDSGGQITIAKRQPPRHNHPPASLLNYLLHKKRFPFLPSHIIFTNKPIRAQLSILHQIMYRLTGDPHIHLNHAAGISPHVVWSALHHLVIRWCRNVQYY